MDNECFASLDVLRKDDVFPAGLDKKKMVELFFPKTILALALDFSNVTSAFYGVFLQTYIEMFGNDKANKFSKNFFYNLGRTKAKLTKQDLKNKFEIPKDPRGIVILLISAIYNASPEYTFKVTEYSNLQSEIFLSGTDRYYRISKLLNIENTLQWPVLHSFMEGIKDELSIDAEISSKMISIDDSSRCLIHFVIKRHGYKNEN